MKNYKNAFTIIENLILICLATLVISGFLFAKKILRENDVKSLIMQIKKYDAALNSFTQKYHALPGDVAETVAYGITEHNTDGNFDNVITDRDDNISKANGEISNFWLHLSKSKMLDENYNGKENSKAKIGETFPLSKLGEQFGIIAFGAEGKTFYQIGFDHADTSRLYTNSHSLKTDEALLLDKKIDDGHPQKGHVVAVGGNVLNLQKNNECIKHGKYREEISDPVCQIRIEAK